MMAQQDLCVRLAERLQVLNSYAHGLLAAVFNFKMRFDSDAAKPKVMNDAKLSPLFKVRPARPRPVVPLAQRVASRAAGHGQALPRPRRPVAAARLRRVRRGQEGGLRQPERVLQRARQRGRVPRGRQRVPVRVRPAREPAADWNVDVMEQFMRLLSNYMRVHILVSFIPDRKIIATVFSRAYQIINSVEEPSQSRIIKYLMQYENPIEAVQLEMSKPISGRLGDVLLYLKTYFDGALVSPQQLRQEGTLNIIALPQNIKKPSGEDKRLNYLSRSNEIVEWLVYGYLTCPIELNKTAAVDVMKAVLQSGFVLELYRGVEFHFHAEFENMAAKSNAKAAKTMVSDATNTAVANSGIEHFQRRELLRLQLAQMLHILRDKPGLAAPKFSQIAAALGMARDEIVWYFRHVDQPSPSKKAKLREDDYRDMFVAELMYLTDELKNLLLAHKDAIRRYYGEYLNGYYLKKLQAVKAGLAGDVDATVRRHVDAALEMLSSIRPNDAAAVSLEALRLNWVRLQVHLSLPSVQVNATSFKDLIPLMNEISARTRYYDTIESYVQQVGSLQSLLFYRQQTMTLFSLIIKHPSHSRFCSVFPSVVQQFLANTSSFYPREAYLIGPKSAQMMDALLVDISKRIADLVHESAVHQVQFARQGMTERAALAVRESRESRDVKQSQADKKNQLPSFKDMLPGKESRMRPDAEMKRLGQQQQMFKNLLRVIDHYDSIVTFDMQFTPAQYLRDALTLRINAYMSSCVKSSGSDDASQQLVKRPSLALVEMQSYLLALQTVEAYIDLKLQSVLREVLVNNVDMVRAFKASQAATTSANAAGPTKKGGARGAAPSAPAPTVDNSPVAFMYSSWYCETLLSRILAGGIIVSHNRRALVSRANVPFKSDRYFDHSELVALVEIIGPNGVRMIENRLVNNVRSLMNDLKESINVNRDTLDELAKTWSSEQRSAESLRKIKGADQFAERAIVLGTLLAFRSLLASAVSNVLSRKAPHIYGCIDNAHAQYPANHFGVPGYTSIDTLANYSGIYRNVDTTLRAVASGLNRGSDISGDRRLYNLMPYMAAASLVALASNDTSVYNPILDAHENNAGSFALAFNKLSVAALSTVCPAEEGERDMKHVHGQFVTVASTLLMRYELSPPPRPPQLDAAYLVLYKFVQESQFVTFEEFNRCLPYTVVRSAFSDAHKRVPKKKISKRAEDEMVF